MVQNDKHNPRIDQAMADHERSILQGAPVDSRVSEQLRDEGEGPRPGQPSASSQPPGREWGTSEGMTELQVEQRSELASYIEGHVFPANKESLLQSATHSQAPEPVLDLLHKLPDDQEFERLEEVWETVSK
jgi:hypothetical protein